MNIVLIGIMGCGKSTVGKLLAEKYHYDFIDADDYLVEKYQMSIPEMFAISEDYFRQKESECLKDFIGKNNTVFAMGGGVIKKEGNAKLLKQMGTVFYLDRPISHIVSDVDTSGRPLLKDGADKLYALFNERKALYESACDYHLINDEDANKMVEEISKKIL